MNPRSRVFSTKLRLGGRSVEQSRRIASEVVEVDGFNIPPSSTVTTCRELRTVQRLQQGRKSVGANGRRNGW
jgi:hypothetical protein